MLNRALTLFLLLVVLSVLFVSGIPARGHAEEQAVPASNFNLKTLDGADVTLDNYQGKYLLINFWATWCGPCKVEMPSLESLYQRFKSDKFDVLAISNDMFGATVVKPFMEAHNLTFPVALDQQLTVSHQYGIVSLPTTVLIDPKGNIWFL